MAGFTFDIGNLSDVLKKLDTLEAKVQQEVKDEINSSALNIESMAKRLAPVNMNTLRGSIYKKERSVEKGIVYTVGAKASYAAYIEFGTGKYFPQYPGKEPEWQKLAKQYYINGRGWMTPSPYFYPSVTSGIVSLVNNIKQVLKRDERL